MSALTKRTLGATLPLFRGVAVAAPRTFSTSVALRKTPTENVKDGLKSVDRAVTDHVVLPGLEAAATAGGKIRQGAEMVTKGKKGEVEEMKGQARGKTEEVKGQARGKAEEVKGQARGKTEEVKGQARGKAEEVKDQARGKADEVKKKL